MEVYKDLWRSEEDRDNRQDFGLANENVRKLVSILCDHGPYGMCDFEYRITLPQSKKIMKAQDGEDVGEYKLTNMHFEYGIIASKDRGLRLHNVVEDVTVEQEQHARSYRREHSKKKHESGSVVVYEEGHRRQRRVRVPGTQMSQRHGGG